MNEEVLQVSEIDKKVRNILDTIKSGANIDLIGGLHSPNRILVLKALMEQVCKELDRQPVYLNLSGVASEERFYKYLCIKLDIQPCTGYQLVRAIRPLKILLVINAVRNQKALTGNVQSQLRGLSEGINAPIKLIVCTTESLDSLCTAESLTSQLAGNCLPVDLR